jgi:xanthosine utilization system XapX-like protein
MAGMDLLFNLPSPPLEIIALPKMVVINLGYKMLAWAKNTTQ